MLVRFGRSGLLRPVFRRGLSTSRICLRRQVAIQDKSRQESARLRSEHHELERFGISPMRPQRTSTGDVYADLDAFLATVNRRIENLLYSTTARSQTSGDSLSDDAFEKVVLQFRDAVMSNLTDRMDDGKYSDAPSRIPSPEDLFNAHTSSGIKGLDALIIKYFKPYCIANGPPSLEKVDHAKALAVADMRNPGEWYPGARNMRRKIIMHVGPTNSGKTYQALKRLESAKSGWYGGPLRLLAHEIFNKMNNKGIKCNLRTGEEVRVVDINATITSSTIEMFSESALYDVAVIDEIQMLADPQRGYAWTAALLGLKAKEIHLCGEEAAVPLISKIAQELGEEIEVNTYQRLSPLTADSRPLLTYKNIKPGDCVVSFSRRTIFGIKQRIEKETGLKCALVYGALPPETRSMQAELFNNPDSGYDVIVASDAIGMGLNLNIKRVIFETIQKYDDGKMRNLFPPQIKQIAGRAGRFRVPGATLDPTVPSDLGGAVTTFERNDMAALTEGMSTPNPPLKHAMLWPPWAVIERFTQQFPDETPLATMISRFADICKTSGHYHSIESDSQIILAQSIEDIPNIDMESRYSICFAPIKTRDPESIQFFILFATVLSKAKPVTIESPHLRLPLDILNDEHPDMSSTKLLILEQLHKIITCYCWLSVRWPAIFTDFASAREWKEKAELQIHQGLQRIRETNTEDGKKSKRREKEGEHKKYPRSRRVAA